MVDIENKEFKNQAGTPNEVGVTDEIGIDMMLHNLGALLDEKKAFEEALENSRKTYDNYKEQWDIDKRLFELQLEHWGKIPDKITHKVELVDEFWELQKKKQEFAIRQETFSAERRLESIQKDIDTSIERLAIIDKEVAELKAKLAELNVDYDEDELMEAYK